MAFQFPSPRSKWLAGLLFLHTAVTMVSVNVPVVHEYIQDFTAAAWAQIRKILIVLSCSADTFANLHVFAGTAGILIQVLDFLECFLTIWKGGRPACSCAVIRYLSVWTTVTCVWGIVIIFGGNDNVRMMTTALIFGIVTISEMFASGKRSTPDRLPLQLSASHSSFQNPPRMHTMKLLLDDPAASKPDSVRGRRRSAPAAVSHAGMKNFAVDAMETAAVSQENAGKQTKGCSIRLRLPVICENVVEDSVLTDKVVNRNAKDLPGFGCNSSDIAPQLKKQSCFWGRLWQFIKAALIGMCGTIGLTAAIYVVIL